MLSPVCFLHSAEGVMRTMAPDKLLKGMPVLQTQIDTLLEFDVSWTCCLSLICLQLSACLSVCGPLVICEYREHCTI